MKRGEDRKSIGIFYFFGATEFEVRVFDTSLLHNITKQLLLSVVSGEERDPLRRVANLQKREKDEKMERRIFRTGKSRNN